MVVGYCEEVHGKIKKWIKQKNVRKIPLQSEQDFSLFLKRVRMESGVPEEVLAEGLMNVSQLSRIESGERTVCKTMRNCLLGRLGVAPDLYENLLDNEDYAEWVWQHQILCAIDQKAIQLAEQLLGEYKKQEPLHDKTKQQFCIMMNAEMMKQQGADRSVLGSLYEMAVCLTVPHVEQTYQEGVPEKLLSVLEVNAILEYEYYRELADNTFTAKCRYWMAYVEDSLFDVLSKAKIYPKIVWYYLRETLAEYKTLDLTGLYDALQVCEQAVEMLRDTGRAYYLTELLDSRKQILDEMIHKLVEYGRRREAERYKRLLQESTALEELLKNLYTTYDVPVYMQDCTYLYRQRWVFAIGDVLRIRRNMLGMTQEQVCEGICSVKSLRRAEKKQANMQREPLGKILMRLGLSKVIQKTALVTNDRSVLHLHHELDVCRNNREPEKARALLGQMKNKLCLEIPENMQFVKECEASLDLMESRITGSEFVERVDEALRCTLKAEKIYDVDEVYLTETEMSCICNKAKEADETEKRELIDFMLGFFEKFKNKDLLSEYISMYEFVMVSVTNELSSLGEYQLAAALDKKGLREVLRCRRLWVINEFLYDLWWMDMQQKSVTRQEKEKMTNDLIQCVIISHFCKRRYYERFYMDTINQFSPVLEE
ncbi:MAG: hypothetical protein K1W27_12770 [Lachnospiraceae bacterium]|jgi:transcriptional regulator with XRE-family HTH domain